MRHQFHTRRLRRADQAIDNRLRRIADGKHPPITLDLEFHAPVFKPRDRITRLKPLERSDQRPFPARKSRSKLPRIETSVCHIATSSARDTHLGKKLRRLLQ